MFQPTAKQQSYTVRYGTSNVSGKFVPRVWILGVYPMFPPGVSIHIPNAASIFYRDAGCAGVVDLLLGARSNRKTDPFQHLFRGHPLNISRGPGSDDLHIATMIPFELHPTIGVYSGYRDVEICSSDASNIYVTRCLSLSIGLCVVQTDCVSPFATCLHTFT